jgi:DNA-binding transcriptional regulator YdaS (Cro superfamily)
MSKHKALMKIVKQVGSVTELAEILGCNKSNVSRWINGKVPIPLKHIDTLIKLSKGELRKRDLRPDLYKIE